jgi:hypothetical protein
MNALIWNICGFGARGRRDQIRDLVRSDNIDLVDFVETFKSKCSRSDLSGIARVDCFVWRFLPASGHSGGILIGARADLFDSVAFDHGLFWASMVVFHKERNVLWEFMVVYGHADHSLS